MRKYLIILIFLLFNCHSEIKKNPTPENLPIPDAENIKINYVDLQEELLSLRSRYDSIKTDNIELKIEIKRKIQLIDTLLNKTIKYQNKFIELMVIQDEVKSISISNKNLSDSVNVENKKLKNQNELIKNQLLDEKNKSNSIIQENKKLKTAISSANSIKPANVQINAYSVRKLFFGGEEKKITDKANKVKYITVSFVIPANTLLKKQSYEITVIIFDIPKLKTIEKKLKIEYNGEEIPLMFTFNDDVIYNNGYHKVNIKSNETLLYEGEINLK